MFRAINLIRVAISFPEVDKFMVSYIIICTMHCSLFTF